ncbi:MAG: trypsin-like peptidase domain-containing protein [Bacillota bacterium]|nr:trypsin-like peptidase domain-containing protein [Bacillota bacterium]
MRKKGISLWLCSLLMLMTAFIGGFFAIGFYEALAAADEEILPDITAGNQTSEVSTVSQVAASVGDAVVGISNLAQTETILGSEEIEAGIGSGVIIDSRGYIVTNNHVIENAGRVSVTLADGSQKDAEIVGADPRTDLALIKIEGSGLPTAALGDSNEVAVGETAIAIGNPGGLDFARSVTSGIISGLDRPLTTDEGIRFKLIQTDAAINPGNSGGALVNTRGQVIGINTVKITQSGFEGMGFAIPSNLVDEVVRQLMDTGKVTRAAMGVSLLRTVDEEYNEYRNVGTDHGVLISVQEGSPAAQAGLLDYDIITAVDNTEISDVYHLQEIIFEHKVGDTVTLKVLRSGETKEVTVTLGELKEETS